MIFEPRTTEPIIQSGLDYCKKQISKYKDKPKPYYKNADFWREVDTILGFSATIFSILSTGLIFLNWSPYVQWMALIAALLTAAFTNLNASKKETEAIKIGQMYKLYLFELETMRDTIRQYDNDAKIFCKLEQLRDQEKALITIEKRA